PNDLAAARGRDHHGGGGPSVADEAGLGGVGLARPGQRPDGLRDVLALACVVAVDAARLVEDDLAEGHIGVRWARDLDDPDGDRAGGDDLVEGEELRATA